MTGGTTPGSAMQRSSHRDLLLPPRPMARARFGLPVDAIVVPAGRPATNLRRVAQLAADAGTALVVLASRNCRIGEAADILSAIDGCRALVVCVPDDHHSLLEFETSHPRFQRLSPGRQNDLARKRNLGLLIARLNAWRKIMFLDDDIFGVSASDVLRVSTELDRNPVAGLVAHDFPDNSVVCHANRLSGHWQGNFITGGALGVNTADLPLDYFPDIYNEDWFFLAKHASAGGVSMTGRARQQVFDPFDRPGRAGEEEFGDLLAEGLYAAISGGSRILVPSASYWAQFIEARLSLILGIAADLDRAHGERIERARESLRQAVSTLNSITPDHCLDFLTAWQADRTQFAARTSRLSASPHCAATLETLGLDQWWTTERITHRRARALA